MKERIMSRSIIEKARALHKDMVEVRRHLHQYPELSFQEYSTAGLAAEQLEKAGYTVRSGVARTGVVADLGKGPTVAIRADMDALPLDEENDLSYRSRTRGVMHACGHDAHVACALAAAQILAAEKLSGRIRMLMQPAEENCDQEGFSGARRMIQDGAMHEVDAVIGLHMDASLSTGKVGIAPGPIMAAANAFEAVIIGKGGHGAFPEAGIDPVVLATQVVQFIQQIVSRRISALEPAIITVGSIQSSSIRGNVISDYVTIRGTVRSFNKEVQQKLMTEVENACAIVRPMGGSYRITWEEGYPVTINDPAVTQLMESVAVELLGKDNVVRVSPKPWSEDFSLLAECAPGAFMFLGCEIPGSPRSHHSSTFDLDESGLHIGAAVLAQTSARLLKKLEETR